MRTRAVHFDSLKHRKSDFIPRQESLYLGRVVVLLKEESRRGKRQHAQTEPNVPAMQLLQLGVVLGRHESQRGHIHYQANFISGEKENRVQFE